MILSSQQKSHSTTSISAITLVMLVFFISLNSFAQVCSDDEEGCTNSFACNYDPEATIDDGSCDF